MILVVIHLAVGICKSYFESKAGSAPLPLNQTHQNCSGWRMASNYFLFQGMILSLWFQLNRGYRAYNQCQQVTNSIQVDVVNSQTAPMIFSPFIKWRILVGTSSRTTSLQWRLLTLSWLGADLFSATQYMAFWKASKITFGSARIRTGKVQILKPIQTNLHFRKRMEVTDSMMTFYKDSRTQLCCWEDKRIFNPSLITHIYGRLLYLK